MRKKNWQAGESERTSMFRILICLLFLDSFLLNQLLLHQVANGLLFSFRSNEELIAKSAPLSSPSEDFYLMSW